MTSPVPSAADLAARRATEIAASTADAWQQHRARCGRCNWAALGDAAPCDVGAGLLGKERDALAYLERQRELAGMPAAGNGYRGLAAGAPAE